MTQKEYIGPNAIAHLENILAELSAKKIFLVTGKTSYAKSGAREYITQMPNHYKIETFCDFDTNPKIEDLNRGIAKFDTTESDIVIAIGGGSVIDMAKMINFFACNKLDPEIYITKKKAHVEKGRPLVAIPTTAGSGSEATRFAVLYIDQKKFSVTHSYILPTVAIVDPRFTMSLSPSITALSGMDAISQAIESYWSVNSSNESKSFAKKTISLGLKNLATAVNAPTEMSRSAMSEAAYFAGKAINITQTTAPHAVSYPLTSFFGIPHGHAVGLTLSSFLVYNSQVTPNDLLDHRGHGYVKDVTGEIAVLIGASNVAEAKQRIDELMKEIGLETKLNLLGINSEEDFELIVANGFNPDRVKNNPRMLTEKNLRAILQGIY